MYLDIKKYIEENNYICPKPNRWLELFHLLQKAPIHNNELILKAPLLNSEWESSSITNKQEQFNKQLEYAFKNACLDKVDKFLRSLNDDEWYKEI